MIRSRFALLLCPVLAAACGFTGRGTDNMGLADGDPAGDTPPGLTDARAGVGVAIDLRTAGAYVILAKTGITAGAPASTITGNLGVSPIAATAMTGLSLIADTSNVFSTSAQVTGRVFASDYTIPTPANLMTAVGDMEAAYTEAAARTPDILELGAGDVGGMTLGPGVYNWTTGVRIPTDVTLSGNPRDIWIFQVAGALNVSTGKATVLTGGAQAKNVFWQ
ncbi:MAG: DUF3494 domain-containing protein, partial [Deltaproteobacteria bacterium]|nr:DUF3494 domain-containing protein [Deltaproteobacteria bacterium]